MLAPEWERTVTGTGEVASSAVSANTSRLSRACRRRRASRRAACAWATRRPWKPAARGPPAADAGRVGVRGEPAERGLLAAAGADQAASVRAPGDQGDAAGWERGPISGSSLPPWRGPACSWPRWSALSLGRPSRCVGEGGSLNRDCSPARAGDHRADRPVSGPALTGVVACPGSPRPKDACVTAVRSNNASSPDTCSEADTSRRDSKRELGDEDGRESAPIGACLSLRRGAAHPGPRAGVTGADPGEVESAPPANVCTARGWVRPAVPHGPPSVMSAPWATLAPPSRSSAPPPRSADRPLAAAAGGTGRLRSSDGPVAPRLAGTPGGESLSELARPGAEGVGAGSSSSGMGRPFGVAAACPDCVPPLAAPGRNWPATGCSARRESPRLDPAAAAPAAAPAAASAACSCSCSSSSASKRRLLARSAMPASDLVGLPSTDVVMRERLRPRTLPATDRLCSEARAGWPAPRREGPC